MRITMQSPDIVRFERDLKTFKRRAYPFATKSTVNSAAFDAQINYRANANKRLVLRNTFTRQSIRVNMAKGLKVSQQAAHVGSIAPYMAKQEFGGTVTGGGASQPIATSAAASQGRQVRPRTKLPTKRNLRRNIQLLKARRGANRKQRNAIAVRQAAKGGGVVYLDTGKSKGLFRVKGRGKHLKIDMVWSLTRKSVKITARPLLAPAVIETQRQIPRFYREALVFQLKKHGLFEG